MKTPILLLLTTLSCFAQYRYNTSTLYTTSTNAVLLANTNVTPSAAFSVASGTTVDIQLAGTVTTNATGGTNLITATFRKGMDGSHWDSSFTFSVRSTTNTEAWGRTNISVASDAYLQLYTVTNGNSFSVTNFTVKVGQKVGL